MAPMARGRPAAGSASARVEFAYRSAAGPRRGGNAPGLNGWPGYTMSRTANAAGKVMGTEKEKADGRVEHERGDEPRPGWCCPRSADRRADAAGRDRSGTARRRRCDAPGGGRLLGTRRPRTLGPRGRRDRCRHRGGARHRPRGRAAAPRARPRCGKYLPFLRTSPYGDEQIRSAQPEAARHSRLRDVLRGERRHAGDRQTLRTRRVVPELRPARAVLDRADRGRRTAAGVGHARDLREPPRPGRGAARRRLGARRRGRAGPVRRAPPRRAPSAPPRGRRILSPRSQLADHRTDLGCRDAARPVASGATALHPAAVRDDGCRRLQRRFATPYALVSGTRPNCWTSGMGSSPRTPRRTSAS